MAAPPSSLLWSHAARKRSISAMVGTGIAVVGNEACVHAIMEITTQGFREGRRDGVEAVFFDGQRTLVISTSGGPEGIVSQRDNVVFNTSTDQILAVDSSVKSQVRALLALISGVKQNQSWATISATF